MKKNRFILFIVLLIFVFSCNKSSTTTYYISDSFKAWSLFQPGSYWVYLDEKKQMPDSIYLDSKPISYFTPPKPASIQYEIIDYQISNGFLNYAAIECGENGSNLGLSDFYSNDSYALSTGVIDNTMTMVSENCRLIERLDTMVINNYKFTNVIHTRDTNNFLTHIWRKDYYFAKNIGLLKFSIKTPKTDSTWSILRWHIIQ